MVIYGRFAFWVTLFLPSICAASELTVHVHWPQNVTEPPNVQLTATRVDAAAEPRSFSGVQRDVAIALPDGQWMIAASARGFWSEPALARSDARAVDVWLRATATINAQPKYAASGRRPRGLRVYFQPVNAADPEEKEGSVDCDAALERVTCGIPAGTYDLAFRVAGFASVYRWKIAAKAGTTSDLGTLHFMKGSTLSGRIAVNRSLSANITLAAVRVTPAAVPGTNEALRRRARTAAVVVHPNERGFFSAVVPAGRFVVDATLGSFVTEEREVTVFEGRESMLNAPMVLDLPRQIAVAVYPAADPWQRPWTVILQRVDAQGVQLGERTAIVDSHGSCVFHGQLPGSYHVAVTRGTESIWGGAAVDVESDLEVEVPIDTRQLRGRVQMGSKPLPADLLLHSWDHSVHIRLRTDRNGEFRYILPAVDRWDRVDVTGATAHVQRSLQDVPVTQDDDGSPLLAIALPAAAIDGTVVDESDRLVGPALVSVQGKDGSFQQVECPDGVFHVEGFGSGRYAVTASTPDRETDEPVEVQLEDDDATAEVVLELRSVAHLKGTVQSVAGPVLSASVSATPFGFPSSVPIVQQPVDPAGEFDVRLPARTREAVVAVNAGGFAFGFWRVALTSQPTTVLVGQEAGALEVDVPVEREGRRPYMIHDRAALSAPLVAYLGTAQMLENPARRVHFVLNALQPGVYGLCWFAPGEEQSFTGIAAPATSCKMALVTVNGRVLLEND